MTRRQNQLQPSRMLYPGEIDHQIGLEQLIPSPDPVWTMPTLKACEYLYHRYVQPGTGDSLPDQAFCDLPRWVFLEYLVRFCGVLLMGSPSPNLTRLEPIVLAQNVHGWNIPRYYAFADTMSAFFRAVVDLPRLQALGCSITSSIVWRFADGEEHPRWGCYFALDYRALSHAPWRSGTIYIYRRSDFSPDFQTVPFANDQPIFPLARVNVHPWDWPLLDQVHGVNPAAQNERQKDTFLEYPWANDGEIHPNREKRPLVAEIRAHLESYYADSLDLSQLGGLIGVSPFSVLRLFRAHIGLSPHEYQTQLRIQEAKRLLLRGGSIAQVAVEVGFYDQTHLTRHFRRLVGITPGMYLRVQDSPIRSQ